MPTEKEAIQVLKSNICYFFKGETKTICSQVSISYESSCSFCDQVCIDNILHCRICTKTYHIQCLIQRGYLKEQPPNKSRLTKQEWNCPSCVNRENTNFDLKIFCFFD